jgi:hypothetical protein
VIAESFGNLAAYVRDDAAFYTIATLRAIIGAPA